MSLRVRLAILLVGLAACLLLPVAGVRAYVLQGGKWYQKPGTQPNGERWHVRIEYSYNNLLDGGLLLPDGQPLPVDIIRSSVEEALGLWASVAPLDFFEVEDQGGPVYYGTQYPDGQFGQIRFNHMYINGPDPVIGKPTTKAMAYYPSSSGNLAGDVFFDDSDRWQVAGTLSQPDVLGVVVHEIGHTLGLGHSTVQQSDAFWHWQEYNQSGDIVDVTEPKGAAVMYWITPRFAGPGTGYLFQDDINGIRAVYGVGVGSVTPLPTVPEPASCVLVALAALGWRALVKRRHRSPPRAE
jgi:hypothetical protein